MFDTPAHGLPLPPPRLSDGAAALQSTSIPDALRAEVLRAMMDEHLPGVLRTLRRLGVRESDVEDAAQDVFTVAHRKLDGYEGRCRLSTWLHGICLRVAADHRRRAHVRREVLTDELYDEPTHPLAIEQIATRQARVQLQHVLDQLPYEQQCTFVLFELEQMAMADVAETTGVPLQTAYARLYAARRIVDRKCRELRAKLWS